MIYESDKSRNKDVRTNWVSSSRFIFYVQLFSMVALFLGMCYQLYQHRYQGKPDVTVQSSTLYTPQYK